jgi:hypothetical protein
MFHDIQDRFGGSSFSARPRALLPHGLETRAWALSSHGADCDRASDTPVATFVHPHASPSFPGAASSWPYACFLSGLVRVGGCEDRRDHR